MKKMEAPALEVVRFENGDIIATSGTPTMTLSGFYDGPSGDPANIRIGTGSYTTADTALDAIKSTFGLPEKASVNNIFIACNSSSGTNLSGIFNGDAANNPSYANYMNGYSYTYTGYTYGTYRFNKQ